MKLPDDLLKKLALLGASLLLFMAVLELVVAPRVLPAIPLDAQFAVPRSLRVLTQSSKAGAVAHDYIALLGDSYAQGAGDWLATVDMRRNPPFHTAHVIQQKTGRDVVSFGASGAGSLRGIVTEPIASLDYLGRTWLYAFEDPSLLLVYFYEGNDLTDNVIDIAARYAPHYDLANVRDRETFDRFVQERVLDASPLGRALASWSVLDNLVLTRTALRQVGFLLSGFHHQRFHTRDWSPREVNRAWIGGQEVALPDGLQAPALQLSEEELDLSLYVVRRALEQLRRRFPDVPTVLVYLPSPLASYRIRSSIVDVQTLETGPERVARHDRASLARRSDRICRTIAERAAIQDIVFVDARPILWEVSLREPIHGPIDWQHYNELGQRTLVDGILPWLFDPTRRSAGCASLAAHFGA